MLFTGKEYHINVTDHIIEYRKGSSTPRGHNYSYETIEEVLTKALYNGLTSFRNKGIVRLRYKDIDGYISFMLVELTDNTITIVTVLDSKHKNDDFHSYVKVQNSIELTKYFVLKQLFELKIVKQHKVTRPKIIKRIRPVNKIVNTPIQLVTQDEINEFKRAMLT